MKKDSLSSEQRVHLALKHKEPDRVPFDLGSTPVTGITAGAYGNLISHLGIKKEEIPIIDIIQQLAGVDEEVLERLKVDTRGLVTNPPSTWKLEIQEKNEYKYFVDEWGIEWRMPKKAGHYYDMCRYPLKGDLTKEKIDDYLWPDPADSARVKGLKEKAEKFKFQKKAIIVKSIGGGMFELGFWMRSFEHFYMDFAADPSLACYLMDKLLEMRMAYWNLVLSELGEHIMIVMEGEDLGIQTGTMISPEMYRKYVKPREKSFFLISRKLLLSRCIFSFTPAVRSMRSPLTLLKQE